MTSRRTMTTFLKNSETQAVKTLRTMKMKTMRAPTMKRAPATKNISKISMQLRRVILLTWRIPNGKNAMPPTWTPDGVLQS